jgi:hypothetical protein
MARGDIRPRHNRNHNRNIKAEGHTQDGDVRPQNNAAPSDRDRATINYIKRILCQDVSLRQAQNKHAATGIDANPVGTLLPPLTSSNEIDVQLYAIIAVILSQFVQAWYNKITPDQEFVTEIVHIIAHCTRAVEERLRQVDLEELLLDELPDLVIRHTDGKCALLSGMRASALEGCITDPIQR